MVANAVPEAPRPGVGARREHELRLLLRPERARAPTGAGLIRGGFWLTPQAAGSGARRLLRHGRDGRRTPATTTARSTPSRGSRHYIGIALGPDPARALLRRLAHVPRHVRLVVARDEAGRRMARLPRRRRVRGRVSLRRPARRPDLGRQHVRGADARRSSCPKRSGGRTSWAVTHPLYVESQIEFGLDEAGYGYWGFSPVEQSRPAATASTASTRSAWSRSATPPTSER